MYRHARAFREANPIEVYCRAGFAELVSDLSSYFVPGEVVGSGSVQKLIPSA